MIMNKHQEQIDRVKPERKCNAYDITPRGSCLNCGYDPKIHGE